MKKDELKSSLGRIRPREELVSATLVKMREQREREERKQQLFTPAYAKGLRLAGAFCAFALVFCIGFVVARQSTFDPVSGLENPDSRVSGELDTGNVDNSGLSVAMLPAEETTEWIVVQGNVESISFESLTDEDSAKGAIARASLTLTVKNVVSASEELSRKTIRTDIRVSALFYDNESLNALVNATEQDVLIRLIPVADDGWELDAISADQQ